MANMSYDTQKIKTNMIIFVRNRWPTPTITTRSLKAYTAYIYSCSMMETNAEIEAKKQYTKVKLLLYSCFYFLYIKPLPAFLLCDVKLYRKVFDGIEFIAHPSSIATCFVMRHTFILYRLHNIFRTF